MRRHLFASTNLVVLPAMKAASIAWTLQLSRQIPIFQLVVTRYGCSSGPPQRREKSKHLLNPKHSMPKLEVFSHDPASWTVHWGVQVSLLCSNPESWQQLGDPKESEHEAIQHNVEQVCRCHHHRFLPLQAIVAISLQPSLPCQVVLGSLHCEKLRCCVAISSFVTEQAHL